MVGDAFGNLMEWGNVLEKLCDIGKNGSLDAHQEGLARILRYKDNWRLREAVLESLGQIKNPDEALLNEVVKLMMDESVYYDARILAAVALGELGRKVQNRGSRSGRYDKETLLECLHAAAHKPAPPILKEAVNKSIDMLTA